MNGTRSDGEKTSRSAGGAIGGAIRQAMHGIDDLGSQFAQDRGKLEELLARLVEERFHLAVLGQFKRGKSSLVNALLDSAQ